MWKIWQCTLIIYKALFILLNTCGIWAFYMCKREKWCCRVPRALEHLIEHCCSVFPLCSNIFSWYRFDYVPKLNNVFEQMLFLMPLKSNHNNL